MRIEKALTAYTTQLEADGRSEHTIVQARRHVTLLAVWLSGTERSSEVEQIRHEDVAAFIASDRVRLTRHGTVRKATSANALRSSLRAFFSFSHAAAYASTNPARLLRRALCTTPPPRGLSDADQERLLATLREAKTDAERRDRLLFTFLLATGARIGSTLATLIEDVDLGAGELRLRREKNRRERSIFLSDSVVALLRDHIANRSSGNLFVGQADAHLTSRHVARRLAAWCKRAGVRVVSPHALRHSFACRIHAKTGDLLLTREALGHVSISSTAIYATVGRERLRAVVAG